MKDNKLRLSRGDLEVLRYLVDRQIKSIRLDSSLDSEKRDYVLHHLSVLLTKLEVNSSQSKPNLSVISGGLDDDEPTRH